MKPALRMGALRPHFFAALNKRLAEMKAQGCEVIRLDEGSPDLPPDPYIVEALVHAASRPDAHKYQPHLGTKALRQAWADWYESRYGTLLDPESEIIPLLGSKEGIFHLSQAFLEPGDLALVPDPGYITYTRGALFAGAEAYTFPLLPDNGYLPDLEAIPDHVFNRAKLLWLNYPNNPTGAVGTIHLFEQAVALAKKYKFLVCHDAAYAMVWFDQPQPPSLLQAEGAKDVGLEFNTLSKSHNMAGWRSGALLGNPEAIRVLYNLKTNLDSGHFLPILAASAVALKGDQSWLMERNLVYRDRRDALLEGLLRAGIKPAVPKASLYVWAPVPSGWDCEQFCIEALEQAGVSMTPGTIFGSGGAGFVRISITAPQQKIEIAMERLRRWLEKASPRDLV